MAETIFSNTTVVTRNEVFRGSLVIEDGRIKTVDDSSFRGPGCLDLEGDYLLPGLIEMHTDNLEKNIQPRPGVIWPSIMAAAVAHDVQIAGAGITTVYDAIAVGGLRESSLRSRILGESIAALQLGGERGIFKADHLIHLRCEIADSRMEEMLLRHGDSPATGIISIMDHTPGQRQWRDLDKWKLYHRDKKWNTQEIETILAELKEMQQRHGAGNRRLAVSFARQRNLPLASHDDTTAADAETAAAEGVDIAEFPTTLTAASRARELGLATVMGAPNAVRGASHSGNISASRLAENGLLDGLSSDYVPTSLLHAAFHLSDTLSIPLPRSVAMISANVAEMVGLNDRGSLEPGRLADLVRVTRVDDLPVVRTVWKRGKPVA